MIIKKLILATALTSSLFGFGAPYSSEIEDDIYKAFSEYDKFIKKQNMKIKKRYSKERSTTIRDILSEQKTKELHLRHIEKMGINESLDKGTINYKIGKFKHLNDKKGEE